MAVGGTAVGVLHKAALAELATPDLVPRPGQFIFIETLTRSDPTVPDGKGARVVHEPARLRQVWLSADGTGDSLFNDRPTSGRQEGGSTREPGCRHGRKVTSDHMFKPPATVACTPVGAYLTDAPTDATAMLRYLRKRIAGLYGPGVPAVTNPATLDYLDYLTFSDATYLLTEEYLPVKARVAVFAALAKLPGSTMHATADVNGRPAVVVGRASGEAVGNRSEMIFDRKTSAFLGTRYIVRGPFTRDGGHFYQRLTQPSLDGRPPPVFIAVDPGDAETVLLRTAIVDRAGQLP